MRHLDTGAMYRCVAYKTLKDGVNIQDVKGNVGFDGHNRHSF